MKLNINNPITGEPVLLGRADIGKNYWIHLWYVQYLCEPEYHDWMVATGRIPELQSSKSEDGIGSSFVFLYDLKTL